MNEEPKKKFYTRWWFWVLVVFIGFPMIIGMISEIINPQQPQSNQSDTSQQSSSVANNSSDLNVKVFNDANGIEITNKEDADWTDCYVGVNGGTGWGFDNPPYRTHGPFWLGSTAIPAGKTITVSYSQLSKSDGTRFDFNSQNVNAILVDCFNNTRSWVGTH